MGILNLLSNSFVYKVNIKLSGDLCLSTFLNVSAACSVARINYLPDKLILNDNGKMMDGLGPHLQFHILSVTLLISHSKDETFKTIELIMNLRCG